MNCSHVNVAQRWTDHKRATSSWNPHQLWQSRSQKSLAVSAKQKALLSVCSCFFLWNIITHGSSPLPIQSPNPAKYIPDDRMDSWFWLLLCNVNTFWYFFRQKLTAEILNMWPVCPYNACSEICSIGFGDVKAPWQLVTQLMISVVLILGRAVLFMRALSGQILPPALMSLWQFKTFHLNFWII